MKYSVISIASYGEQMTASGYISIDDVHALIDQRDHGPTGYREHIIIGTTDAGVTDAVRRVRPLNGVESIYSDPSNQQMVQHWRATERTEIDAVRAATRTR